MSRYRFEYLLAALLVLLIAAPLLRLLGDGSQARFSSIIMTVVFSSMLLAAVYAVYERGWTSKVAVTLAGLTILFEVLELISGYPGTYIAGQGTALLFLVHTIVAVLRFLFRSQRVTANTICASLCVYLLLAILWAVAYSLLDAIDPGSFAFAYADNEQPISMRFGGEASFFATYYSLVTITTLGYGDIVPITPFARMLAAVEAAMGQMYIAVLVARLVGLHVSQPRS
jgi:hypothetical protein